MNQPDTSLRIKAIKVTRLFGLYDHQITLKADRVTVIHGPNGVGKTVLLKLIDAFLGGRYHEILQVPFASFEICFSDGSLAQIQIEGEMNNRKMLLRFEPPNGPSEIRTLEADSLNIVLIAEQIVESTSFFSQIGPNEWRDKRTDEVISSVDLIAHATKYMPEKALKLANREPKGMRELLSQINVHLIETQRLLKLTNFSREQRYRPEPERHVTNTVQAYSYDLKNKLESALATYAKQSQKLDQTFPQRLLQHTITPLTIEQLKQKMQQVEATRDRLKRIGILDSGDSTQESYPLQIAQLDALKPEQVAVMSVYAGDTEEKLAALGALAGRVEILLDVLNRKFVNKRITVTRETGLAIFDRDNNSIPVGALSSGEQHELVLLYDLLFKVKPNTLVLIDEPELSLHVSWQKSFMDDLLDIIRLASFDVIMATHSPYIVGEHSDLLVELSPELES